MKYLNLFPNTQNPVRISQFALGCDHFGEGISEERAFRIMDAYYEQGGTLLDTAHVYSLQEASGISLSEKAVGKWISANGLWGKVVLSDKGAHPNRSRMLVSRISEKNIRDDLASSLETLRTDCVDIWFLHRDNPDMPVGEIVDIVSELVDRGYMKHLGVSNWSVKRISQALEYARRNGKHEFEISQLQWSLAVSTPESWEDPTLICMDDRQQEWYRAQQFPVMAFSSQARGLFSKVIEQGVDSISEKTRKRFLLERNMGRIERCRELCRRGGVNPAGLCLSYLTSAPFPAVPVIGCSSPEQVKDSLRFADSSISEANRDYLVRD